MATVEQRRKLLAETCPFCGAKPGQMCSRSGPRGKRYVVATLDGNAHDARWQKAGLGPAPVVTAAVEQYRGAPTRERMPDADPDREPVTVGDAMAGLDRPW